MWRALIKIIATLVAGAVCFIIGKLLFVAFNPAVYSGIGVGDVLSVLGHGFSMDLSVSAYFSIVPAILFFVSIFYGEKRLLRRILKAYFALLSLILGAVTLLDTVIYGYWLFKLDSTPLFYFLSSPSSAFASMEWWMAPVAVIGWLLLSAVFFMIYCGLVLRAAPDIIPVKTGRGRIGSVAVMLLSAGLLFVAIRGGVTVSTMNISRAYFSSEQRLNHAAVNPVFSLMYSLTHQDKFSEQYRYLPAEEASMLFGMMTEQPCDSVGMLLREGARPDVYLIILESFSSHLFPSLGGERVAIKLDSIASEGLMFTRFYANSFRTDRGLVSIISGYPGQPNTSIMKFVSKTERLPSFSRRMRDDGGYATEYYYGGDANFTNMRAYLVNAGFDKIVSDLDFPVAKRLSKWGVHDGELFVRVIEELTPYDASHPKLRVIQTSSSHEPFDVPYDGYGRFSDPRPKAFAYADSCAASFISSLRESGDWGNSLVIVVPDHYGAYPETDDPLARHRIPLFMTGGALARHGVDHTVGAQTDIAATLLGALGLRHDDFIFSHNLFNPCSPHFAFFADPSRIGIISDADTTVFNLDISSVERYPGASGKGAKRAQAFLQTLYDDLSKR